MDNIIKPQFSRNPPFTHCQATDAAPNSQEEEERNSRSAVCPSWPSAGAVRVEQLTVRYGSSGLAVLRSLSFRLAGGEKCGVVGRTGAGKSTLMLALLRLVESSSGTIHIDDLDIASLPLATLRSKVVAIPQEPVLFSQSLRFNLDPMGHPPKPRFAPPIPSHPVLYPSRSPITACTMTSPCDQGSTGNGARKAAGGRFSVNSEITCTLPYPTSPPPMPHHRQHSDEALWQHSDEALWSVLATVRLKPLVARLLGGLDGALAQGGGNLSLGQRQLLCLARYA
ncbi:unnamed protein product [Closterium sp. NIES-65]|nr:unnamed protein product [Closterium sp. NIES-65]